jgi:hypothetical protein
LIHFPDIGITTARSRAGLSRFIRTAPALEARRCRRGRSRPSRLAVALALVVCAAPGARAQIADRDPFVPPIAGTWETVRSMGQPPRWKPVLGLGFGIDRPASEPLLGTTLSLGIYRDVLDPLFGLLGATGEGYVGHRSQRLDGGGRLYLSAPALFVHAGVDWNARLTRPDLFLSATVPTIRGGWFRQGGLLRVDWMPGRDHSVIIGTAVPVGQPFAGRTRPRQVDVRLPRPPRAMRSGPLPPGSVAYDAVAELRRSMTWVMTLHNIFWLTEPRSLGEEDVAGRAGEVIEALVRDLAARDSLLPDRNTYEREIEHYHRTIERAFALALDGVVADPAASARTVAAEARHLALVEVLVPYNRTVGQYKKPDVLDGLIARARARFIAWLEIEKLPDGGSGSVLQVFDAWLAGFEALRAELAGLTQDSRMHWLPLAFALHPDEHETRAEIDAIIERALERPLTSGNATHYIDAAQFQAELHRTIHATETYHVLWIHDYRGRNELGAPDAAGFHQTTEGYLRALLNQVRAYDTTGRLPVYLILLDQHSYEINDSRRWLDLLERPLQHRVRLPARFNDMRTTIEALQDSLRLAVATSRRLAAESAAFGPEWIDNVIKVHVNVTNPSDFSFRSARLLGLPIGADNLMRDHRKIVIRDVTEADPAVGEAILVGVGVGEKYLAETWEDRGLVLQGPAALAAKDMARAVLETQGLRGSDLPQPLRPAPLALDYARRIDDLEAAGATARVLQAHNRTGWGAKDATFVQMLLYDLVPAGTIIYVPDSLWTSYEWLAQLVSAALRGCRVFVVAPARDHAPSAAFPQMSAMQELITRLMVVQDGMRPFIEEAGGELRVGLYTRRAAVHDLTGYLAEVDSTFGAHPFLQELFPFSPESWSVIRAKRDGPPVSGPGLAEDARGRPPLLHRKTQLLADARALADLAAAPGMPAVMQQLLTAEAAAHTRPTESGPLNGQHRLQPALGLMELYRESAGALADSTAAYLMVGSLNKDIRGMALDGEVLAVVSGEWALQAFLDFFLLSGGITWMERVAEVDALLPPYSGLQRLIGRLLHRVL